MKDTPQDPVLKDYQGDFAPSQILKERINGYHQNPPKTAMNISNQRQQIKNNIFQNLTEEQKEEFEGLVLQTKCREILGKELSEYSYQQQLAAYQQRDKLFRLFFEYDFDTREDNNNNPVTIDLNPDDLGSEWGRELLKFNSISQRYTDRIVNQLREKTPHAYYRYWLPTLQYIDTEASENRKRSEEERNLILRTGDHVESFTAEYDTNTVLSHYTTGTIFPFSFYLIQLAEKVKEQRPWAQQHVRQTLENSDPRFKAVFRKINSLAGIP